MKRFSRVLWLPAILAAATLACSLIPSLQTTPTPPPAGETAQPATSIPATLPPPAAIPQGKIAFASEKDGTWQVIAMNPDGSDEVQLTAPFSGAYSRPSWSPDGTRLGMRMDNPTLGIAVMDVRHSEGRLTGTQPVALVSDFSDGPFWAPDGQSLLYSTTLGSAGGWLTFRYDLATGQNNQITGIPENATDPDWSPDGSRIVFTHYTDSSTQIHDLFVVNIDGSGLTNLTNTPRDSENLPAWSPDGSRIAFSSSHYNEDGSISASDLFIMNADGSNRVQLTTHPEGDFDAAWSPDGTMLAFTSERDSANDNNYEIYLINADGTGEMRLTNNRTTDRWPSWRASLPEDAPPAACQPALTFVADVTIPPGTRFALPQPFTKIWRVRNAGACAWTTGFRLQASEGAWAGSEPVLIPGAIQPGAEADLTVRVSAPDAPGLHTGSWTLVDGNGQPVPNTDGDVEGLALQVEVLATGSAPLSRPLYFTRSEGGLNQLFRLETDGRTQTRLTNEPSDVEDFAVGPDGRIAYTSAGSVVVIDSAGGNRQAVATYNVERLSSLAWSPDGSRLAYASGGVRVRELNSGSDILLLPDVDTGVPGLLLYSPQAWSPDGSKLIVRVGQWEGAAMNIISATDGTILAEVPFATTIWGRNSQNVFYSGVLSEGMMMTEPGLWAQPAAGGNRRTLMSGNDVYWPAQAPDGPLFAFVQKTATEELALIRTDESASELVPVLPRPFYIRNSDNFFAAWSADAGSVAMYVYRPAVDAGEFTVHTLDGSPPLFLMQEVGEFAWGP